MMESEFFTVIELCQRYSIKQSTLYEWIKSKNLPKPLKFGRLSRWRASDIAAWESSKPQETTPAPAARVAAVVEMMKQRGGKKAAVPVDKQATASKLPKPRWSGKIVTPGELKIAWPSSSDFDHKWLIS